MVTHRQISHTQLSTDLENWIVELRSMRSFPNLQNKLNQRNKKGNRPEINMSQSDNTTNLFDDYSENKIFESTRPLGYEFFPSLENIVAREEEIKQIRKKLKGILKTGYGENFVVTGNTGLGKTTCVKAVLNQLDEKMQEEDQDLTVSYIEACTNERQVLRKLAHDIEIDYRGSDLSKYYHELKNKIVEEDASYILVLDDIDHLFSDKSQNDHGNSLLKKLYEVREYALNNSDGGLVVGGVTNNSDIYDQFNPKNRSRYADDTIDFSEYNSHQLRKILGNRAEKAFKQTALQNGVLNKIAAYVAKNSGDARKAIRVLKKAGQIAEETHEQVKMDHVDEAIDEVETNQILKSVKQLALTKKYVLYSVMEERRKKPSFKQVYDKYEKVCSEWNNEPVSERQVRYAIDDLDMFGLVETGSKSGRGGKKYAKARIKDDVEDDILGYMEEEVFDS